MATPSKPITRLHTEVWLIGQMNTTLTGRKLPSKREVLAFLFFLMRQESKSLREALHIVVQSVLEFWNTARIPTTADYNVINKLEKLYNVWRNIYKGRNRRSAPQVSKEDLFKYELDNIFDIAHQSALTIIKIEEDKEFLLAQREPGRRGYMSTRDDKLAALESARLERQQKQSAYHERHQQEMSNLWMTVDTASIELEGDTDSNEPITSNKLKRSIDDEEKRSNEVKKVKRGTQKVISDDLGVALDRTQISDRKAVHVIAATATTLGHNLTDLAINRSSIRRARIDIRQRIAEEIKHTFDTFSPLTLHWDGKILPSITGKDKVERLPVLVSGGGQNKLLGVPKLCNGKGETIAKAVTECVADWNLNDRIQALCFDTTSSNTGGKKGACAFIENEFGRALLNTPCRHHVLEITLRYAFSACKIVTSTGPTILLFKRFQQHWSKIDQDSYESLPSDVDVQRDDIICFCKEQLKHKQTRDDYREFLELSIIYLGGIPPRGVKFMQPGAMHQARWMAKALYAIKMDLFHSQFKMTAQEIRGIHQFAMFVVLVYVRAWFLAPVPALAPANDLVFLRKLLAYDNVAISKATVPAFGRHLWYISELLVPFAFFDETLSFDEKTQMVVSINSREGSTNPTKRLTDVELEFIANKPVAYFVTKESKKFFDMLELSTNFMDHAPCKWDTIPSYIAARDYVNQMKVVNDLAERGVALMECYNNILTKNEDQKQYILQVVEQHRNKFTGASKSTLSLVQQ